jgi:hypothetical protein
MGQNGVPGRAGVPGQPGHMGLPGKKMSQKKKRKRKFQCFSFSTRNCQPHQQSADLGY